MNALDMLVTREESLSILDRLDAAHAVTDAAKETLDHLDRYWRVFDENPIAYVWLGTYTY